MERASWDASPRPQPSGREEAPRRSERGQGSIEYGLLVAAAALFVVVGILFLAGGINGLLERAGSAEQPSELAGPPAVEPSAVPCHASYDGVCIPPPPPDLDCADIEGRGIPVPVTVGGSDPHKLDPDGDGLGC
jgi:Flp pilus assembly pilin Flp